MTNPSHPRQWVRSIKGKTLGAIGYIVTERPKFRNLSGKTVIRFPDEDHPNDLVAKRPHLCVNASAGNAHQVEVWYTVQ